MDFDTNMHTSPSRWSCPERTEAQRLRVPPAEPIHIYIGCDADPSLPEPTERNARCIRNIAIEATGPNGALASWFDDLWWAAAVDCWGNDDATLSLTATPDALLHPVVLHEMAMIARAAPRWRTIAYAYADDIRTEDDILALARSAYNEVRFQDSPRPGEATTHRSASWSLGELFGQVQRRQRDIGVNRPILVRLPAPQQSKIAKATPDSAKNEPSALS